MKKKTELSRRDFVRSALGTGVALSAPTILGTTARGQGKTFKVGLIGSLPQPTISGIGHFEQGNNLMLRRSAASAVRHAIKPCLRPTSRLCLWLLLLCFGRCTLKRLSRPARTFLSRSLSPLIRPDAGVLSPRVRRRKRKGL